MPQSFRLLLAAALVTALVPASRPALITASGCIGSLRGFYWGRRAIAEVTWRD